MKRIATILLSVISYAAMGQVYPSDAKPAPNYGMIWQSVDTLIIGSDTTFLFDWVDAPLAANIATLADINVYANSNASTVNNEITVTNNIGLDGSNVAGNSNTYRLRNDDPLYFDGTIPITLDVDGEVTYIEKRPGFGINSTRGAEVTGEHYWTDEIDTSEIATQYDLTQINVDDADADPTNELDSITINGTLLTNGSSLTIDSGVWSENGSNIYYNSGNVGIGTNVPAANLDVEGDFATIRITDDVSRTPRLDLIRGSGTYGSDVYGDWRIDNTGAVLSFKNKSTTVDRTFLTLDGTSSSAVGPLVGINVTNPTSRLHIDGEITSKVNSATSSQWLTFYDDNSAVSDGSFLGGIRAYETDGGAAQTGAMYWKYNGVAGSSDLVLESTASIELDAPTIGSGLIYSNAGVLANASIGTGLSFSGGVLSNTSTGYWNESGNRLTTTSNLHVLGGGFGGSALSTSADWNGLTDNGVNNLLVRSDTNGPPETSMYYHVWNWEYSSKNGSGPITQFAVPYGAQSGSNFWFRRSSNGSTWGDWVPLSPFTYDSSTDIISTDYGIESGYFYTPQTASFRLAASANSPFFGYALEMDAALSSGHARTMGGIISEGATSITDYFGSYGFRGTGQDVDWFYIDIDGNYYNTTNFVIRDAGVGINTSSPGNDLHIAGGVRQTDATNAILYADADGDILGATLGSQLSYASGTLAILQSLTEVEGSITNAATSTTTDIDLSVSNMANGSITNNLTTDRININATGYYKVTVNYLVTDFTGTAEGVIRILKDGVYDKGITVYTDLDPGSCCNPTNSVSYNYNFTSTGYLEFEFQNLSSTVAPDLAVVIQVNRI